MSEQGSSSLIYTYVRSSVPGRRRVLPICRFDANFKPNESIFLGGLTDLNYKGLLNYN